MKIVFLGTGTSVGVPVIGCQCPVCVSSDPRNRRRRSSLYVESGGMHLVVDTTPDFREQVLANGITQIDAVLLTHSHADHIFGFDDVRAFNDGDGAPTPVFGSEESLADMRRIFDYVQRERVPGMYRPRVAFRDITGPFDVGGIHAEAFRVDHDPHRAWGYLLESEGRTLGYFPDCSGMPAEVEARLGGVDVMVLDALRHRPHRAHYTLAQSVEVLKRIRAGRSYIIHMCHELDHEETENALPDGMHVSYDGLTVEW
jgi:phosphoribosyl 1,2-cyclic phosphate phosphodiesterase